MKPPTWRRPDRSSFRQVTRVIKRAGSRNLVDEAMDPLRLLVASGEAPEDVEAAVTVFQARPFYTPAEMAALWPLLARAYTGLVVPRPAPMDLRAALVRSGLPLLRQPNGSTWFAHNGRLSEWFAVQDAKRWARVALTQGQFDAILANFHDPEGRN